MQQAEQLANRVVIGMDPHKRSVTIELMMADESVIGSGRYTTDEAGFAAMMRYVSTIQPDVEQRVWAVEGCNGIGHHVAGPAASCRAAGRRCSAEDVGTGAGFRDRSGTHDRRH